MPHVNLIWSGKNPKEEKLLPSNNAYPVPWRLKKLFGGTATHMGYDRGGLYMWGQAGQGVPFTGIMHMATGEMYIRPVTPERPGNVEYKGGIIAGREILRPLAHNQKRSLDGTFWEGLGEASAHNQLGQSAAWDAILKKISGSDLKGRCQGFGSEELFSYKELYVGYFVIKRAGSATSPHELAVRSGTFNGKFTRPLWANECLGVTMPAEWAAIIKKGLEVHLT